MRSPTTLVAMLVVALLAPVLPAGAPVMAQEATPAADCPVTTAAENQAIVQRFFEIIEDGDLEALDEVLAPGIVQHALDVPDGQGIADVQANLSAVLEAFPDLRFDIEQWLVDDEYVAARTIQHGTHLGDYAGIPTTEAEVTWTAIETFRIECGLISEEWGEFEEISILRQIGYLPQQASSGSATPDAPTTPPSAVASATVECPDTSEEENETLIRRWYDEVYTQGNLDNLDEILAPDLIQHRVPNRVTIGANAREETLRGWLNAFPDLQTTPELILTDGDLVLAHWIGTGTHEGAWGSIAPTGSTVRWTAVNIYRIECGRIAEEWAESDGLAFYQQLDLIEWPPVQATPEATPATG